MVNFGGVIDEEISEEFLMGTCINDIYKHEFLTNEWGRLDLVIDGFQSEEFCGRFNSMMTTVGSSIYIFGGTYEIGDDQFILDDIYRLDVRGNKLTRLQALSPEVDRCWTLRPTTMESDSDLSSSESSSESSSDEEDLEAVDPTGKPMAAAYPTLKEFFDSNVEYWMDVARAEHTENEINDKKLRSTAFLLAKQEWDTQQELKMNLSLE